MGNERFNAKEYMSYSTRSTVREDGTRKHYTEVFTNTSMNSKYDPTKIKVRESVDSEKNPESRAVIVALDVTGSMGEIPNEVLNNQLGRLMTGLVSSNVVKDPHLMFMAVGDVFNDSTPLQVTQFEADERIAEQLHELYVEGRGGGNSFESYDLPWIFAAHKTKIDCWDKRQKKGYLFTVGDEMPPQGVIEDTNLKRSTGLGQGSFSPEESLKQAQEQYDVFHIIVEQGSYAKSHLKSVKKAWYKLLGPRTILLKDYTKIADVITAAIALNEGHEYDEVVENFANSRQDIEHAFSMTENSQD